jgi:glycosyltransferase involved in cell wall biosynthesis
MAQIAFVSDMAACPWGGSEELWSRAALRLVREGHSISASVVEWHPLHSSVRHLIENGIRVYPRPQWLDMPSRIMLKVWHESRDPVALAVDALIKREQPDLVVFSAGGPFPWVVEGPETCIVRGVPFAVIAQSNWDTLWPDDEGTRRHREAMIRARRYYFVSHANLRLAERQLGCDLPNAEVVQNPFNVGFNTYLPWPKTNGTIKLACVARLHPPSKGQDLLFEALSEPQWQQRDWHLSLYGEGPSRDTLQRLAARLKIDRKMTFAGHHPVVEDIWREHHALVLPSRAEGLPLVVVEAMLCGRPVVTTDVAGNGEVVTDNVTGFLAKSATARSIGRVLERFWDSRSRLQEIGEAGAKAIRQWAHPDPAGVFSDKIKALI